MRKLLRPGGITRLIAIGTTISAVMAAAGTLPALASPAGGSPTTGAVPVTTTVRSDFTGLYASLRGIPRKDIAALTAATVQEAYQPSQQAWWAVARFQPAAGDPLAVSTGFQDGAGTVVFTRHGGGRWRAVRVAGSRSLDCPGALPADVQRALRLTDTAACAAPAAPAVPRKPAARPSSADPASIAAIAANNIGVADTPASTNFGFDCDPYTTLVGNTWVSSSGCGTDPRYGVQNRNEEWCADFAKYVWEQGGVTADLGTLTAGAASFYTWGAQQGESMPVDPSALPAPGDAIVFYGPGLTPGTTSASHVGIVTSVNSDGTINMANGDFSGSSNISVQGNNNISLGSWSASIWGAGTRWVYVSPGSGSVVSAFQANTGFLWTDTNGSGTSQALGMATGTSPSIATSGGVFEAAFQSNDGYLWITNGGANGNDLALGMAPGTSPSITALPSGGFEIAFQANNGDLWLVGPNGVAGDTELGMAAGTSPSVAASPGGGYEVAFQANDGYLWTDTSGASKDTTLGMASGTSPSIVAMPGGGYSIAFQANTGYLWTASGTGAGTDEALGMAAGTSPAIAASPGGGFEVAYQANTGFLWTVTAGFNSANLELGMAAGTSPSITPAPGGGYEIAIQANTGYLWTDTNGVGSYQPFGMAPGTSPAISS